MIVWMCMFHHTHPQWLTRIITFDQQGSQELKRYTYIQNGKLGNKNPNKIWDLQCAMLLSPTINYVQPKNSKWYAKFCGWLVSCGDIPPPNGQCCTSSWLEMWQTWKMIGALDDSIKKYVSSENSSIINPILGDWNMKICQSMNVWSILISIYLPLAYLCKSILLLWGVCFPPCQTAPLRISRCLPSFESRKNCHRKSRCFRSSLLGVRCIVVGVFI